MNVQYFVFPIKKYFEFRIPFLVWVSMIPVFLFEEGFIFSPQGGGDEEEGVKLPDIFY